MSEKGYQRLKVYQKVHQLVKKVYGITQKFPKSELFGLVSQMRRAVVSVVANIVEGQARSSKKEFKQFLYVANGSLVEVEYYGELGSDLRYITTKEYQDIEGLCSELGAMLRSFIKSLT